VIINYELFLENWNNAYSNYLTHDVVYATCGVGPLFTHHYDFSMELNLRRALNHEKVIAVGEIGLDFERWVFL
jgi:Tat protein secretion system quality control protein TatD with DNase activity